MNLSGFRFVYKMEYDILLVCCKILILFKDYCASDSGTAMGFAIICDEDGFRIFCIFNQIHSLFKSKCKAGGA